MARTIVTTEKAPAAIGPYSQAIKAGDFVFVSGQIPIVPDSGTLITDDIQKATRLVLTNIRQILISAGSTLENIVKATIFLNDMNDFQLVNEAYAEFFPHEPPARACVEVSRLPKDAIIEIEAVALLIN